MNFKNSKKLFLGRGWSANIWVSTMNSSYWIMSLSNSKSQLSSYFVKDIKMLLSCADPEVRHSNTEESMLYSLRRKYNIFWAPLLILPYVQIRLWKITYVPYRRKIRRLEMTKKLLSDEIFNRWIFLTGEISNRRIRL